MSAVRPEPAVLEGRFIRLEPMTADHYPGLWEALGHPAVFAGGYGGGPEGLPPDEESFLPWVAAYYAGDNRNNHVLRITGGPHDGVIVGASTLGDFDVAKRATHIGWTGYDPRVWGTQVNAEAKLLMLGLAFDHGFERVKLQADSLNERSRAAIAEARRILRGRAAQGAPARRRHPERDRRVLDPRRRVAGRARRTRGAARVVRRSPGAVPQRGRDAG